MDVRQLEYFLAVVDHGGVNKAALALHVAQPSMSQTIRRLESQLKTELFHRVGRGLVLAPAGEALVGPARRVLREIAAADEAVREVRQVRRGRLDIASLSDISADPLSVWVAKFRVVHPQITVRVEERDDVAGVLALVKSGVCELGLTMNPFPRGEFASEFLVYQRFVLVLPPGTGGDLPDEVPLSMLKGVPLVMGERNSATRGYVERMLRDVGVEPLVAVEVPQRGAVMQLVLSGAGAAIMSLRVAVEARQRGAVVKPLSPEPGRDIGVFHRSGWLSEVAAEFLDHSRSLLGQWERAIQRRIERNDSLLEATISAVEAMERKTLSDFLRQSPLRGATQDD